MRAIPRVTIGCNPTWLHDHVVIAEPQALFDHGTCPTAINIPMLALVILIIGTTYAIKEINDNVFI